RSIPFAVDVLRDFPIKSPFSGDVFMPAPRHNSSDPYDRSLLRTVHLVPLTAYDSSGRLASDVQARHTARMYAAGIRVFLPAAGTSEFHSLSADEIVEIVRVTRDAAGPDAQIFAPVGLQLSHAIDVGRRSIAAGANGIMFMPFAHPYLSNAGARDYYRQVIDAVNAPTLVYKKSPIPGDDLLLELAGHPHVVGIKYAENNLHDFRKVVLADRGRVEWLCGSAERFAPYYMLAGAPGFTTGAGNVCPHLALAMHTALASGEYAEGMRWQKLILPIEDFRAKEGDSFNISMLKHALKVLGEDFGPPRPPQRQLSRADQAAIEDLLGPILTAEQELKQEAENVGLAR
ncbi:MAG TPA: dihydrodipicolinate synthase family protein, partial [Planctomycetaceae bacterium]|nr:dihydrodipicolinate synthase family protein [Planctomycetaceae bacterium]